MPLKPQNIPIVFAKGADTKTDDKSLPIDSFAALQNVIKPVGNRFTKRYGLTSLPNTISGGGTISGCHGGATYNGELLEFSNNTLYSFSPSTQTWYSKGSVSNVLSSVSPVVRNSQQQTLPDMVENTLVGVTVTAWEDTRGGVWAKVVDTTSNTVLVADMQLNASGSRPKAIAAGSFCFVYYVASGHLYVQRYNRTVGTAFDSAVSLANDVNASGLYDATAYGSNMLITWNTTGNQIKVAFVTPTPVLGAPGTGFPSTAIIAENATTALSIISQNNSIVYVAWFNSTNGTRIAALSVVSLASVFSPTTVDATTSPVTNNITMVSTSNSSLTFFYEVAGATSTLTLIKQTTVSSSGAVGGLSTVRRSVGLASKAFLYNGSAYIFAAFDSTFQAAYYLLRQDGFILTRNLYGNGGGLTSRTGSLREVSAASSSGVYSIAVLQKTKIITENNTSYTRTGVSQLVVDFSTNHRPQTFTFGQNLYLLGGLVQQYDGISFVENNFNMFPEIISYNTATTGGNLANGTYLYYFLYEWIDARGEIHRSIPSAPITVVLTGGTSTQTVTWTLPTLRLSARTGSRTQPLIVAFRTQTTLNIPYRISSQTTAGGNNGLVLSDDTVDTVTFVDGAADASISGSEILYTAGSVLDNEPPPPCTAGVIYDNRLIVNSTESGNVSYTKNHVDGEPAAFSEFLTITAADASTIDPVTAFGAMDGNLLLGKGDFWYVTNGDGYTDNGQGNNFPTPTRISTSTGCPYPDSVVNTKDGIVFKSKRGYRLLARNLVESAAYGAPVFAFDSNITVAAISMHGAEEVRMITTATTALVYNEYYQQWTVFTNYAGQHAVLWNDIFVLFSASGKARFEDTTTKTDDGSYVSMYIETGWLPIGGAIQGFGRVWELLFIGQYVSPHQLQVRIATDFEPSWKEINYFNPATAINGSTYGSITPYGAETPMGGGSTTSVGQGGVDSVYQGRMGIVNQKCEAMKISFQDIQYSGLPGEGLSLSAMSLKVGVKGATYKTSQVKVFGSGPGIGG